MSCGDLVPAEFAQFAMIQAQAHIDSNDDITVKPYSLKTMPFKSTPIGPE